MMVVGSIPSVDGVDMERQSSSARSSRAKTKVGHDGRGERPPETSPEISGTWTGIGLQRIVDRTQDMAAEENDVPDRHRQLSTIYDRTESTSESADSQRNADPPDQYPFKVRAMGNWIPRSPSEISFKKGDILHSAENEGKRWWKVKKANGSVGSAPSNYFKVINS
ncbi:hypothetical protein B0H12DRAFT_97396 [Mycena haematopus]|nr:hypothetical protein B0H12DRAFT_97396 [Mycena haematopus]